MNEGYHFVFLIQEKFNVHVKKISPANFVINVHLDIIIFQNAYVSYAFLITNPYFNELYYIKNHDATKLLRILLFLC